MTLGEQLLVMKAVEDGKAVEYRAKGCEYLDWSDMKEDEPFNFEAFEYRVKDVNKQYWLETVEVLVARTFPNRNFTLKVRSLYKSKTLSIHLDDLGALVACAEDYETLAVDVEKMIKLAGNMVNGEVN